MTVQRKESDVRTWRGVEKHRENRLLDIEPLLEWLYPGYIQYVTRVPHIDGQFISKAGERLYVAIAKDKAFSKRFAFRIGQDGLPVFTGAFHHCYYPGERVVFRFSWPETKDWLASYHRNLDYKVVTQPMAIREYEILYASKEQMFNELNGIETFAVPLAAEQSASPKS
jgi:hypothetical protein